MAGDVAEMMLDGTMDPETGEFNFDGADGPGFPMTGAEAAAFKGDAGFHGRRWPPAQDQPPLYGLWREIGLQLEQGLGTVDQISAATGKRIDKIEAALDTMFRSGLVHHNRGPWALTKRGRRRLEDGNA